MNTIKTLIIYFACIFEKLVLLPFSNIRCSTIEGVLKNDFEAKRLLNRTCIGLLIILLYLYPVIIPSIILVGSLVVLIYKKIKK